MSTSINPITLKIGSCYRAVYDGKKRCFKVDQKKSGYVIGKLLQGDASFDSLEQRFRSFHTCTLREIQLYEN